MARYRLNNTKYALKITKEASKRSTFNTKTLSTLSDPNYKNTTKKNYENLLKTIKNPNKY